MKTKIIQFPGKKIIKLSNFTKDRKNIGDVIPIKLKQNLSDDTEARIERIKLALERINALMKEIKEENL